MFEDTFFNPIRQVAIWNKNFGMFEYIVKNRDENILGKDIKLTEQDSIFINVINELPSIPEELE